MKTFNTVALVCSALNIAFGIYQRDLGKALFGLFLFLANAFVRRWCE